MSSIHGLPYVCKGSTLSLSVDDICGSTAIMWSSATDLNVYNGQGTTNVTYRPNNLAANGTVVTVTATAYFPGGCTANLSSLDVTIYDSGTPPTPAGNVTIVPALPEEYDPCSEVNITWFILYDGTYPNGIITVDPTFVLDAPHHHTNNSVNVEVCYRNLCGSGNTCRTYTVYLPEDCIEDPIVNPNPRDSIAAISEPWLKDTQPITIRNSIDPSNYVVIYPNPASNSLSVYTNFENGFCIQLYDLNGKLVQNVTNPTNFVNLDISVIGQGIYSVRIFTDSTSMNKRISIVK